MDPQQQFNSFGRLPQRRGEFAKGFAILSVLVSAITCVMAVFIVQDKGAVKDSMCFFIYVTGRLMLSFIIGKVMHKFCQFCEEVRHWHTRYNGNLKKFGSAFAFSSGDSFFFFVAVFLVVLSHVLQLECTTFSHVPYQFWIHCLSSCWVALLSFAVGCREPSILELSRVNERENKNVADGLAWGYYVAYLKVVLPKLDEQIGKSVRYRDKISRKKLYILMPKNGYIFQTIQDADSRVTVAEKLKFTIDRAGTPTTYTLTVHSIQFASETEPCYLVLEYCTTLMTLYEMNTEAGLSREQRDEQVVLVFRKLMEILEECPQCKNKYEFVPFSGERDTIANVLEEKIKEARVAMPS